MEVTERAKESLQQLLSENNSEEDQTWRTYSQPKRTRSTSLLAFLLLGALLASALWSVGLYFSPLSFTPAAIDSGNHARPTSPEHAKSCGTSPTEARSLGCVFQLWSYSWVPSPCFDSALESDFLALANSSEGWGYYIRLHGRDRDLVNLEDVSRGDRNDLFSTWGQHYWHCAFYQRKFFRMIGEGDKVGLGLDVMTNKDEDKFHASNCQDWLADPFAYDWALVNINLTIGYHSC